MPMGRLSSTVGAFVLLVAATVASAQPIVGVLGIPSEVIAVERRLVDSHELTVRGQLFRVGTLGGRRVVVARSGAGKVNAAFVTALLISRFDPDALFFSGTAGAVDQTLHPGDVVIGATVAQHDTGAVTPAGIERRGLRNGVSGERDPILLPSPAALLTAARAAAAGLTLPAAATAGGRIPRIVEGVIATGDLFISDARQRDELRASLGAAAVEMEGAAVVQVCRQFAVPCLVIRSITDRADGQASDSYEQFRPAASDNAAALVAATISQLPQKRY
jgi:adenosylhomocysteine nucleosidase